MSDLFDFANEEDPPAKDVPDDVPNDDLPDWEEVPQARFLSWSPEMQFAYCARRDQDSALRSESVEEFDWFTARAVRYKELIK